MKDIFVIIIIVLAFSSCSEPQPEVQPESTIEVQRPTYQETMLQYQANERQAMVLFSLLRNRPEGEAVAFIDQKALHLWDTNVVLLNAGLEYASTAQKDTLSYLMRYCVQRREMFRLIGLSLKENTSEYDPRIMELDSMIVAEMQIYRP